MKPAHTHTVGILKRRDILIQSEIHLGLPFQIRRNLVTVCPQTRALRVVLPLQADEIVESNKLFLRVNPPEARRSRCRLKVLQRRVEQEIVIKMIAFARPQVVSEPSLVLHRRRQPTRDPIG